MTIAITGATGFVGQRLLKVAGARDLQLRALTRRDQPEQSGVSWVRGNLEDEHTLGRLVEGASAVIHIAGVINAPDKAGFDAGNVTGTANMLAAAKAADVQRFIHVSSLAAREPKLSLYGGSKARSEELVRASGLDHTIVRPPAVYGPGDKETLELFKMARRGLILMPPKGRASYIHADDLSGLLLDLATSKAHSGDIIEPDDGKPGAWEHKEFGAALAKAVGGKAMTVNMPSIALNCAAAVDKLFRGDNAKMTKDRAAYFCHCDWAISDAHRPDPSFWRAAIATPQGLSETASWYEREGWI